MRLELETLPPRYQEIARIIGIENAIKLGNEFGGGYIYLPKLTSLSLEGRNKKIAEEFDGHNYNPLARKYNLTVTSIRRIIEKERASAKKLKDG
ncbi:MAG TPA: Mor transcription activator family protein [Thermodesulfovibrionales bacterium]|nr:Mor transcription activator family protein [Thermodesulfovibrionales bacterium]